MNSEVFDTTPNELRRDFHAYQKLFGRNEDIYDLIKEILKPPRVLVVRGSVGSGRTGVVAKAVTYLIERGKYKDEYIHLNLSNCSKHIDF
jgi:protein-tyrosine phosphatase